MEVGWLLIYLAVGMIISAIYADSFDTKVSAHTALIIVVFWPIFLLFSVWIYFSIVYDENSKED